MSSSTIIAAVVIFVLVSVAVYYCMFSEKSVSAPLQEARSLSARLKEAKAIYYSIKVDLSAVKNDEAFAYMTDQLRSGPKSPAALVFPETACEDAQIPLIMKLNELERLIKIRRAIQTLAKDPNVSKESCTEAISKLYTTDQPSTPCFKTFTEELYRLNPILRLDDEVGKLNIPTPKDIVNANTLELSRVKALEIVDCLAANAGITWLVTPLADVAASFNTYLNDASTREREPDQIVKGLDDLIAKIPEELAKLSNRDCVKPPNK